MKNKAVVIEINKETFNNFHNAVVAYLDILNACILGCDVSGKFEKFKNLSNEELVFKRDDILNLYHQIEKQISE